MSLREEFVSLAVQPGSSLAGLCRRFGISRKTGYKWLWRYRAEGCDGLADRSRRPHHNPNQIVDHRLETAVLTWRLRSGWGGRKLRKVLENEGWKNLPSASTISSILKRHGCLVTTNLQTQQYRRFVADAPNALWQMDFKGPVRVRDGTVEPLTVLDDHSRFSLGIRACTDQTGDTVKQHLTDIFRRYGMPWRMLADNGNPWGKINQWGEQRTVFEVWLMTLGIELIHSRPCHPQTCGKEERFHRTLKQELAGEEMNVLLSDCQMLFDAWRHQYNTIRPHEGIDMATPASRYRISDRVFPERIAPPEYDIHDIVRSVRDKGRVCYKAYDYKIGSAFHGQRVAIRPTEMDEKMAVYFYKQKVAEIDLRNHLAIRNV